MHLFGHVVHDAEHQANIVEHYRTGVGLNVANGAVSKNMGEVERLMAAGQACDVAHDRKNVPAESINLPGVLRPHLIGGVIIKAQRGNIRVNNSAVAVRID